MAVEYVVNVTCDFCGEGVTGEIPGVHLLGQFFDALRFRGWRVEEARSHACPECCTRAKMDVIEGGARGSGIPLGGLVALPPDRRQER